MREPIENLYFDWLCAKVDDISIQDYRPLLRLLFHYEFVWVVPMDKHRVSDGLELRDIFCDETHRRLSRRALLPNEPCSVLEMMVAFAERASFQTVIPAPIWFWEFMRNLGLDKFGGEMSDEDIAAMGEILYTFTWRIYGPDGVGGMFPMNNTQYDQREMEIWFQFCEYLSDRGLL